jgi:hypothetical protein
MHTFAPRHTHTHTQIQVSLFPPDRWFADAAPFPSLNVKDIDGCDDHVARHLRRLLRYTYTHAASAASYAVHIHARRLRRLLRYTYTPAASAASYGTHTRTHARTHARTHPPTHARARARTHARTHKLIDGWDEHVARHLRRLLH